MIIQERLRQAIDQQQRSLRASVPPDRQAAILALLHVLDRRPHAPGMEPPPDLITGHRLANLGGNKALQLCLESTAVDVPAAPMSSSERLASWGQHFLHECGRLAKAQLVLAHCESGFMRMVDDGNGTFDAWIATKRPPTNWRERADIDWWAGWLARCHGHELQALRLQWPEAVCSDSGANAFYQRLANVHVTMMEYQLLYPPDAVIDGCTIQTYRDVLGLLIGWALQARDRGEVLVPRSAHTLVTALASALAVDTEVIGQVVTAFTLDRESAVYHAALPGVAAPLVRVDPHRLVWSLHGLTTEPLFFLARELKRRDAQAYHNAAHLREVVFRQDLYALFPDRRFVTSTGRIELRRDGGDVRTDIDAVVFDRTSGTLGVFELKSQDPFARSNAELVRQRDNVLYANRQISGVLAWMKRHGGDALLSRVDTRTARTFRVQNETQLSH